MSAPLDWTRVAGELAALAGMSSSERAAALERIAGEDPLLAHELQSLIPFAERTSGPLEASLELPTASPLGTVASIPDLAGHALGSWTLVERIGAGGMGVVYRARRADAHFDKDVAVKFLAHAALDEEGQRRFAQERRILARLEHPYIARLLDAGSLDVVGPFVVMELVEGRPIDAYCEEEALPLDARLRLFVKVCEAVQEAHRRLIVHRDIKPTNVLVDAEGRPRLLDFGIAKLLESEAAGVERTATRLMTPHYAAPEQITGEPVTTATDVYALGVLLHRLLTGRSPYGDEDTDLATLQRAILEGTARPATVDAELDNVIAMAMAREPERRYASAAELAHDVEAYLEGLPLRARPASASYRLRKFVGRHRVSVTAAAALALSLVAGAAGFAWQAREASLERDRARIEAETAESTVEFLKTVLWSAHPWDGEREATVADVLAYAEENLDESGITAPRALARIRAALGEINTGRGDYEAAERHTAAAVAIIEAEGRADEPDAADVYRAHGAALVELGDAEKARAQLGRAITLYELQGPEGARGLAASLSLLGAQRLAEGEPEAAEADFRRAIATGERVEPPDPEGLSIFYNNLSMALSYQGRADEASAALARAIESARAAELGDATLGLMIGNRAGMLSSLEEYEAAEPLFREAMDLQARSIGSEHPEALMTTTSFADLLNRVGRYEEATAVMRRVLEAAAQALPESHMITAYIRGVAGLSICQSGEGAEGEALLRGSAAWREENLPDGHWAAASSNNALGACLVEQGRFDEAEALLVASLEVLRAERGEEHLLTRIAKRRLEALDEARRAGS